MAIQVKLVFPVTTENPETMVPMGSLASLVWPAQRATKENPVHLVNLV